MTAVRPDGLEELSRSECLQLLGHQYIGRVVVTMGALPVALPVNFAMLGDDVVFRTGEGGKLDAAARGAVVAFEVDSFDAISHTGWSVLVTGPAAELTDREDVAAALRLPLRAWAGGPRDHFVRITSTLVSGRRIGLAVQPAVGDGKARTNASPDRDLRPFAPGGVGRRLGA